jgi:hypothetical protein
MNLAGETEVLGGNLPRRHFVHHKIPRDDPVTNPGPQRWEASDYAVKRKNGRKAVLFCFKPNHEF